MRTAIAAPGRAASSGSSRWRRITNALRNGDHVVWETRLTPAGTPGALGADELCSVWAEAIPPPDAPASTAAATARAARSATGRFTATGLERTNRPATA